MQIGIRQSMPSKNLAEMRQVCNYYLKLESVKYFKAGTKCGVGMQRK